MRIVANMQYEEKVKVLSADSKPYNIEGNEGVSHRVRFLVLEAGEIFNVRASAEQVEDLKDYIGSEGVAVLVFKSPKENLRVELVSFEPSK